MDPSWLLGLILGVILIVNGISDGFSAMEKLNNFYDFPSIVIVLGGTAAALIASYPLSMLAQIPKHIMILFRGGKYNIPKLVDQLVDLAMIARQSGLLALEEKAEEIKDPFLKQSVLMIVDASDADKVRAALEKELETMIVRHDQAAGFYEKGSGYAPAFGMIGTLVGLVNMLKGMNFEDGGGASSLGQDMSVALITTFYGSALANLFFQPIAKKLRLRQDEEELYCSVIIDGVLAIMAGDNPKTLRERLLSSLKQGARKKLLAKAEKSSPAEGGGNG
ncbi:MAG: motility protein A [Lachnospiraceae bacterium]|jgi:chemotaxis protein MotA|nr:motility protein A [Lachnospiraceae bacterium]